MKFLAYVVDTRRRGWGGGGVNAPEREGRSGRQMHGSSFAGEPLSRSRPSNLPVRPRRSHSPSALQMCAAYSPVPGAVPRAGAWRSAAWAAVKDDDDDRRALEPCRGWKARPPSSAGCGWVGGCSAAHRSPPAGARWSSPGSPEVRKPPFLRWERGDAGGQESESERSSDAAAAAADRGAQPRRSCVPGALGLGPLVTSAEPNGRAQRRSAKVQPARRLPSSRGRVGLPRGAEGPRGFACAGKPRLLPRVPFRGGTRHRGGGGWKEGRKAKPRGSRRSPPRNPKFPLESSVHCSNLCRRHWSTGQLGPTGSPPPPTPHRIQRGRQDS